MRTEIEPAVQVLQETSREKDAALHGDNVEDLLSKARLQGQVEALNGLRGLGWDGGDYKSRRLDHNTD